MGNRRTVAANIVVILGAAELRAVCVLDLAASL